MSRRTARHLAEKGGVRPLPIADAKKLKERPFLTQHDGAAVIEADDVERVLTNINADYGNRSLCCSSHGVLLVWAPLTSLSLAGQEHGRTIPLADIVKKTRSSHVPSLYDAFFWLWVDMKRREFIAIFGAVATGCPLVARSQQATARIALLGSGSAVSSGVFVDAFKEGLREHGLV